MSIVQHYATQLIGNNTCITFVPNLTLFEQLLVLVLSQT